MPNIDSERNDTEEEEMDHEPAESEKSSDDDSESGSGEDDDSGKLAKKMYNSFHVISKNALLRKRVV